MKRQNFDERQLLAHSRAFQYAFITFMAVVMVWELLCDICGLSAEPFGEMWLLLMPPMTVFAVACIVQDAYDPIQTRPGMIVFTILPVSALVVLADKLRDHTVFAVGKCITEDGGLLILETMVIGIAAIYWIRTLCTRRKSSEE